MTLIMESSYAALHMSSDPALSNLGCRSSLVNREVGFYLGMGGSTVSVTGNSVGAGE